MHQAPSPSAELDLSLAFTNLLTAQHDDHQDEHQRGPSSASSSSVAVQQQQLADQLSLVVNPPTFSASDFHNFAPSLFRCRLPPSLLPPLRASD